MTEFEIERELRAKAAQQKGTAEQEKFWPEPLNMKQFLSRPRDTTRYIWDSTWAARGASIIVAQSRDGKSYFVLNAGAAISRGVPFLGRETVKSPVLYLSLDNSLEDMDQFVEKLGVTSEDQIFIQPGPIPANAEDWLVDMINRNGIKLAIIDTLQRFFQLEDSNDYSEAVTRMTPLDNLAKEIGFHIVYVHHAGKSGSFLGSTAFKAMCPTFMELMRVGELQQRILKSDQRNGKNFDSVAIGMNKHGWLEIVGTYEDAQINEVMPKIRELLETHEGGGLTETNIRRENAGSRGIITSKAMGVMYRAGTIERTGEGKKGDPFKYYLAKTLSTDGPSYSYSLQGGENSGLAGQESKKQAQPIVNAGKNSSPGFWDKNGTSTDKDDGWEIVG